jgi:hypothetical protein
MKITQKLVKITENINLYFETKISLISDLLIIYFLILIYKQLIQVFLIYYHLIPQ